MKRSELAVKEEQIVHMKNDCRCKEYSEEKIVALSDAHVLRLQDGLLLEKLLDSINAKVSWPASRIAPEYRPTPDA
ncbi:MAG TPA: hypothetical protein VHN12_04885 [Geobacteraceae bacterium]|nr:hypothetical protein [Geobacteraceae bacterium]